MIIFEENIIYTLINFFGLEYFCQQQQRALEQEPGMTINLVEIVSKSQNKSKYKTIYCETLENRLRQFAMNRKS